MEKVVKIVGALACPMCDAPGFDFEAGADIEDPGAALHCERCGHVWTIGQFIKSVVESKGTGPDSKRDH
jgi:uncharacterized protein YbaR (Trm112 family)